MNPARIFLFAVSLIFLVPLVLLVPLVSSSRAASLGDVVINEIQIDGAGEWIKLYNPTEADVDLEGLYWCYFPSSRDWNEPYRSEPLSGQVPPYGYFLMRIDGDVLDFGWDTGYVGVSSTLNNSNGSVGIFPFDPKTKTPEEAREGRIDVVAWGEVEHVKEGSEAMVPGENQSIVRDPVGQDTDDNSVDFSAPDEDPTEGDSDDEELQIDFTLPAEVTAGEGFDVPVTVRNAHPSGVYYAKAVIGELTEGDSLRKGYTYNSALDKWLAWNGKWTEMPTFETDADGDASFTLKSKVKDDAEAGTYYYLVRIRKVDTDNNVDSEAQTFPVTAASVTSDTFGSSDPEVTFSVEGSDFKVNQSFDVKVEIKNAKPKHDYYIKIRIGLEEGKLTKGRTYSSFYDSWRADNSAWKYFPVVYTDGDGSESITVSAKVASGNPADTYYIIGVRIRDKETEKNYDSETQTLDFSEEDPPEADLEDSDGTGAVLGAATELPATGGGLTSLLVICWLPVLGWMILIFLGSSTPGVSVSGSRVVDFIAHKIVHVFEYALLFVLIHRAVKRTLKVVSKSHAVAGKLDTLVSFGLTVGYAVTDEIHQMFVPGRDARLTDVLIDAGAALLGWLAIKCFRGWSKLTTTADKIRYPSVKTILYLIISSSLLFFTSTPAFSASHLSFFVPDGYELKEGEIDHLGGTLEIFDTRAAATSFKPDFNFDLAGFATFVYSYEKYYGALDPSAFTLTIYEGLMGHANLDDCWVCKARPSEATIVEGKAGEAPTYQLFFAFEPVAVKARQDYTAILTTTETTIGRYRFWIRSQYYDGFFLVFNPVTQEFTKPSSGHLGAPFGLFVEEGWQGTPPRFHPVVLIHGMGGRPTDWSLPEQDYISLIREMYATDEDFEYPASWIHTYHYGNLGWEYNYQGDIREIALGLEAVVDDLATRYAESFGETLESLEERDEDRVVDIVGYSMGGLVARQYLIKHQDNHHIRKLLTIATPHRGIYWLGRKEGVGTLPRVGPKLEEVISEVWDMYIALADQSGQPISLESDAALQMVPDSEFYDFLNLVEWTPLDVQYYTIYGDIDINLKEKVFFFTLEKKVALGDVFIFSESAVGIPAVEPKEFGYNEEWTFPVGVAITPDGVSARFYLEGLDIRKFRFWHLGILRQPEIKDKTINILSNEI